MNRSPLAAWIRHHAGLPLAAAGMLLLLGVSGDPARNAIPQPKPPALIPDDALFSSTFDKVDLAGWRPDRPGVWRVVRGMVRADLPDRKQEHSLLRTVDSTWTDYAVDLDVCAMRGVDKGVVVRAQSGRGLGVDLRGPGYNDLKLHLNEIPLGRVTVQNANGVWQHIRVEVRGNHCRVLVNGEVMIDRKVPVKLRPQGGIALAAYTGGVGECTVFYDNVVVTSLTEE